MVDIFSLKNDAMEVRITNLGGIILSLNTPDRNGDVQNIVAGFRTIDEYRENKDFFGCIVGRYANRIANGKLLIDGICHQLTLNDGKNTLHGGKAGFDKQVWQVQNQFSEPTRSGIELLYVSKDGEEGFPGNLTTSVTYVLSDKNELIIQYKAVTDQATAVSLTNHSYFNLTAFENDSVLDHTLQMNADEYIETNEYSQPTGRLLSVEGSVFDFRCGKKIGENLLDRALADDGGYNHNFVLKREGSADLVHAAALSDTESGRTVNIFTTCPGMQVYTANLFDGSITGSQGKKYQKHSAVALETQNFPDSPNHDHFPSAILYPGEEYHSTTIYSFGVIQP